MRKRILTILAISSSLFVVLFAVLVIHIAMIKKSKTNDNRNRQLSRIDFIDNLNHNNSQKIKQMVLSLPGVDGAFVNEQNNILVYSHNPEVLSANVITNAITKHTGLKAKRYTVTAADLQNGCPAGYEKNLVSKMALALAKKL